MTSRGRTWHGMTSITWCCEWSDDAPFPWWSLETLKQCAFLVFRRNEHLGLCTERFNPFESFSTPYSCWLVILTVYNLPSKMCVRPKFIYLFFLSMVIHNLNSLGRFMDEIHFNIMTIMLIYYWMTRKYLFCYCDVN
jgi:hypothetical protein